MISRNGWSFFITKLNEISRFDAYMYISFQRAASEAKRRKMRAKLEAFEAFIDGE
ncbi:MULTISPECIES: hypothetical protein [Bacillus]|uniref:hypothetical protein n=1 Tax=Bacillus TaxID=1386 RepID=UPI00227E5B21|nr:hypothetical protein [Bacillus pumilus]MCY7572467.1 hypothetical protein [Bacillus pumilus]MEC3761534.1 hypothetical protein [Bacillus pumilus]